MPEENERICSLRYCPLNHVGNDSDKFIKAVSIIINISH